MSRPFDNSMKFWSCDIGIYENKKFRRVKDAFGHLGVTVYLLLLDSCYGGSRGYYTPYETEDEKNDCIFWIQRCLAGKHQPNVDTIKRIIDCLIESKLFDKELSSKILTSKRIQETYYYSTKRRKNITVNPEYWLLSLKEMSDLSDKHSYYLSVVGAQINDEKRALLLNLFGSVLIIDDGFKCSAEQYTAAAKKWHATPWLKENLTHLSKINGKIDRIISGYYDKHKESDSTPSVSRSLSPEQLDSEFPKIDDSDL